MTIASTALEMSLDAWAALDEDAPGELVDGFLEEEERPTAEHEAIALWLAWALRTWVGPLGGKVFGPELKLGVGHGRGRKADASVYLPGRPLPGRGASVTTRAPSIVIEVLSPKPRDVRRDVVDKVHDYAAFGVEFYWIVDPRARVLEVLERAADGRFALALTAAEGAHAIPGCDGLVIDLGALWKEIDDLPESE